MKISFISPEIGKGHANTIAALPVFKKSGLKNAAAAYDKLSGKQISAGMKAAKFDGSAGKGFAVLGPKGTSTDRLYVAGCGPRDKFDTEMFGARMAKTVLMNKFYPL